MSFLNLANPNASLEANIRAAREPTRFMADFTSEAEQRVATAQAILEMVNAASLAEQQELADAEEASPTEFRDVFDDDPESEIGNSPFSEGGGTFKLPIKEDDAKNVRDERAARFLNITRTELDPEESSGIGPEFGTAAIASAAGAATPVGLTIAAAHALKPVNDALGSAEFEDIKQPDGTIVRLRNGRPIARYKWRAGVRNNLMESYEYRDGNVTVKRGPSFGYKPPPFPAQEETLIKGTPFTARS